MANGLPHAPRDPRLLLELVGAKPHSKELVKAAVNAGLCLAKCEGGAQDGAMLWTMPGPPEQLNVEGSTYVKSGTMPNNKIEAFRQGFFLWRYIPEHMV